MTTVPQLRAITADGRELDNPSEVDLHDLLADMNFGHPFLTVERTDLLPSDQHYIQVHMDLDIDPEEGRGYFVEYRDGGPDRREAMSWERIDPGS